MKKRNVAVIMLAITLLLFCSCDGSNMNVCIFNDIQECNNIDTNKDKGVSVQIMETPDLDIYLGDIAYEDFYGCNYVSSEFNFRLFAYEFIHIAAANEYFHSVTGKTNTLDKHFSDVAGITEFRRIVLNQNRVFVIYTTPSQADNVIEFINSVFTENIVEGGQGDGSVVPSSP